jgi:hypothetical protein
MKRDTAALVYLPEVMLVLLEVRLKYGFAVVLKESYCT